VEGAAFRVTDSASSPRPGETRLALLVPSRDAARSGGGITWHRHETRLDLAPTRDAARSAAEGAAFRVSDSASSPRPGETRLALLVPSRDAAQSGGGITWHRHEMRLDLAPTRDTARSAAKGAAFIVSDSASSPRPGETRLALLVPSRDAARSGGGTFRVSDSASSPRPGETRLALLVPSRDAARSGGGITCDMEIWNTHLRT